MDDQDYLIHYGVLGMKWGVRKARKTGGNYNYTSMKTKRLTKKAANAKAAGKKNAGQIAAKAKASKQSDKNRLAYAKKTSVGKAIAQNLLLGPIYAQSYQKMRANGATRGKAILKNVTSRAALMSIPLTGFIGANAALNANLANMTMPQIINAVNTMGAAYRVSNTAAAAAGSYIAGNKATTSSAKKKKKSK